MAVAMPASEVSTPPFTRYALRELAWHALPPALYFLGMLRGFPYWNSYWVYADEGYNLIKSLLIIRGYTLYTQIWSDQPPLFNHLLALLFRVNGPGVYASRVLVLLFSCLMLWAVVQFLRLAWGDIHALAGAAILILLPHFLTLSAAALVGQPSLGLAMVSLWGLAAWHRHRRTMYLILSAAAFGASLLFKLYTGFLAPLFLAGLLISEFSPALGNGSLQRKAYPALIWLLVCAGFALVIGLLLAGPASLPQLIGTHWAASQASQYPPNQQLYPITFYLRDAWAIILLACIGGLLAFKQRRWLMLYPLAWMFLAFVSLLFLKPVWFHHQLLVTVPGAVLAGAVMGETARLAVAYLRSPSAWRGSWVWLAGGLVASALVLATALPGVIGTFQTMPPADQDRHAFEDKVLRKIEQYAPRTSWMVTDMPMYAFRAGISVPPDLAVISWKRLASGELTEAHILDTLQAYQPEQILLGRFEFPSLDPYLQENYHLILERPGELRLFVRKDLLR